MDIGVDRIGIEKLILYKVVEILSVEAEKY